MSANIFGAETVKPFRFIGLTGDFWTLHIDILIATWLAMVILFLLTAVGRRYLKKRASIVRTAFEKIFDFFIQLCKDSFPKFNFKYFSFIFSIFLFTFFSSVVGVLPFIEEATRDINTTFAIGLTSLLYVHTQKIKVHGIGGYLKEYLEPFFLLAPIHIVGELSKIASMSFRLFGNILGGGVIILMIIDLIGQHKKWFLIFLITAVLLSFFVHTRPKKSKFHRYKKIFNFPLNILFLIAWLQMFLGIFEGLIQSFVVTMLTTTYLAIGTHQETDEQQQIETLSGGKA